jgi:hypothetical protein
MGGDQRPLLRRRLVPALLFVVPATAAVSASAGIVQAVEECRLEPGWPAPSGSKWLSRINRDHHRCWFLSSRATGHHAQLPRARSDRNRPLAGVTEAARRDPRRDSDLQAASAPMGHTDVAVAVEPPSVPQAAAPSVEQSSENLIPHSVPTIAYKVLPTPTQTVAAPTIGAARVAERTPAGASTTNLVFLAGAAGAALLFAGGTFHFTRQKRARTSAGTATRPVRGPAVTRSPVASKRPPLTTDPADDLKRSLLELKRDLKNASKVCNLRPSREKVSSGGAISLPPTAAWLTRPKVKPTMEQQLADA